MAKSSPHDNLAGFFDMRARQVNRSPSREELCFASGRDPRLWTDEALYQDMIDSICTQAGITADSRVLEVGCAAGYLAAGIAARCRSYVGVDFAPAAVARARSLALSNARFESADATALPMADGSFDAAFAYDMFTNFDGMELPRKIMSEMVRVVRPGGNVLIGSIPDAACAAEFEAAVDRVRRELDERVGPPRAPDVKPTLADRARLWFSTRVRKVDAAAILCFYFRKSDFEAFGRERGLDTAIEQVHAKNPFYGLRFNVRYRKPRA